MRRHNKQLFTKRGITRQKQFTPAEEKHFRDMCKAAGCSSTKVTGRELRTEWYEWFSESTKDIAEQSHAIPAEVVHRAEEVQMKLAELLPMFQIINEPFRKKDGAYRCGFKLKLK